MIWHRIAERLGKSVSEAKCSVTATEFHRWDEYFKQEWHEQSPLLFHLAQIAYQVYLVQFMFGGKPSLQLEHFLMKFQDSKPPSKELQESDEERQNRIAAVKSTFISALSMVANGQKKRDRKNAKTVKSNDPAPTKRKPKK